MKLLRKLPETKQLISGAIKSGSAPNSDKAARSVKKKRSGKEGKRTKAVANAADVEAHTKSLAGVEMLVNLLNSGAMADIAAVDIAAVDYSSLLIQAVQSIWYGPAIVALIVRNRRSRYLYQA